MKGMYRIAAGLVVAGSLSMGLLAQAPAPVKGVKFAQVSPGDLKEWLTYLASDELQGRAIYTEGYGLAAGYIAENLRKWGVKPIGDHGSYFQIVKQRGYKVARNSSVTVEANGQTRIFKHGDHVAFPLNGGGKQTLTFTGAEFLGSAAPVAGMDLKGKLAVWMPIATPAGPGRGGRGGGPALAAVTAGVGAIIGYAAPPAPPTPAEEALTKAQAALAAATEAVNAAQVAVRGPGRGGFPGGLGGRGGAATVPADLTGVQNVNLLVRPTFTADDTFFEALLAGSSTKLADLKAKAEKGEPLTAFSLPNAKITVNIDNTYDIVSQQLSHNVVGMVEGTDPKLKDTYVLFGSHLDHVGYSQTGGGSQPSPSGCRARSPQAVDAFEKAGKKAQNPRSLSTAATAAAVAARSGGGGNAARGGGGGAAGGGRGAAPAANPTPFDQRDFISNGADDDGSGSTALLGVAKAFATGPRPKRSVVFVWHAGEEAGLLGSRYNADFPVVPLDKIQAQLNMDMVGRDDCNNLEGDYSNSVFVVGADRISTDLHNLIFETNQGTIKPLSLDYELNDATDPENVYTRSDHFSYAAKGIPIAFFTTGLHPDYHRVTDSVEKITFPKMARITQLVYETGFAISSTDKLLERDNKGPRTGFGTPAAVIKK